MRVVNAANSAVHKLEYPFSIHSDIDNQDFARFLTQPLQLKACLGTLRHDLTVVRCLETCQMSCAFMFAPDQTPGVTTQSKVMSHYAA